MSNDSLVAAAARLLREKKKKKTEEACESIEGSRSEETVQAVGGLGFYWHTARDTLIIKLFVFVHGSSYCSQQLYRYPLLDEVNCKDIG